MNISSFYLLIAPCQPQNLRTSTACQSDVLTSTWDLADGALSYAVQVFGNKNGSFHYNCSSFTNSCAIPGISCGESLTTYITAFDDECPSEPNLGDVAETGMDRISLSTNQINKLINHINHFCRQNIFGSFLCDLFCQCPVYHRMFPR